MCEARLLTRQLRWGADKVFELHHERRVDEARVEAKVVEEVRGLRGLEGGKSAPGRLSQGP